MRATCEKKIQLHLESTEALLKYFFAHDHLNYARLLPIYLSCMQSTEKNHPDIWKEFPEGNFCVTKNEIPFTSIAPDHALEQENRCLKVSGGIIGITQNENALKRFFLIAPELEHICTMFEESFFINSSSSRVVQHHDIEGTKLERMNKNKARLQDIIEQHGDPFISSLSDMNNLLTHAVLPENVAKDVIDRDAIGRELHNNFIKECLTLGNFSPWDQMSRRKLCTFAHMNTSVEVNNGDKIIKLKEERGLLQRFVIVARCRPDLDLKDCIGNYEFGVIPRSLFQSDGLLLFPHDKSKVMHGLEGLISECTEVTSTNNGVGRRLILFDGMELVNSIKKSPDIETCFDLANVFIKMLVARSEGFEEVHLVFNRYLEVSLKTKMRSKRTHRTS